MSGKITITENQKEIINKLNNPPYTVEYLSEWINRKDDIFINAPAALNAMSAKGYYKAILAIEKLEAE